VKISVKMSTEGAASVGLGRAIRYLREAIGLSQDELAAEAGIGYAKNPGTAVGRWESAARTPNLFEFHRTCVALCVTEAECLALAAEAIFGPLDSWGNPIVLLARERLVEVRTAEGFALGSRALAVRLRGHGLLVAAEPGSDQVELFGQGETPAETESPASKPATQTRARAKPAKPAKPAKKSKPAKKRG